MRHPEDFLQGANASFIDEMYARFQADPASVPDDWALFFTGVEIGSRAGAGPAAGAPTTTGATTGASGVYGLVYAYREHGHLVAHLDPLGEPPADHPYLALESVGLSSADLDQPVDTRPFRGPTPATLRGLVASLRETYCRTLGADFEDVPDPAQRAWLAERMESTHNRVALAPEERVRVLERLMASDAFEQFLHVRYVGQKRFSLEGGASLIPMLDALIESAAAQGVEQLVIGMPHRGRLNVLAHVLHKPLERMFGEFESGFAPDDPIGHGDVKYHLGYSSFHDTRGAGRIHLDLMYNPSHLEFVNPVVLGSVRARQDHVGDTARGRVMPVLLHGDASLAGEGIVVEALVTSELPAYQTGGTVHIVVNNQVGFTTSPRDAHASRYCTEVARVIGAPVLHVNGDDPETCIHAIQVATEFRMRFKRDVFVDLVCYRRHGHNELDDPTFTQPVMYRRIAAHVPAAKQYAERLVAEGVIDAAGVERIARGIDATLQEAHRLTRSEPAVEKAEPLGGSWAGLEWAGGDWGARTAVPRDRLLTVAERAAALPEGFHPHAKIQRLLAERAEMIAQDRLDWGLAEVLAFGSVLLDGRNVRLSGQDTGRGTFSHRHAVLADQQDGRLLVPLQHLAERQGRFDVIDSPLNEAACMGFEYGYSTADPHNLVVWEAQFGDFANVAQVIIDQFLASAESKWRRMSGLVLLLPHGYEGQGPEHSSARLERFLQLCAHGNLQVCDLTTPAQLFHALRRQLARNFRKPLVIMSPKSLLRHKRAVSPLSDFTDGTFQMVLDDPGVKDARAVRRVLLMSGKVFFTVLEARDQRGLDDVALVRIEQLYPFPHDELRELLRRYPGARELRWVQEEPANMGAWRHIRHRLEGIMPNGTTLSLAARKAAPTSATGFYSMHLEQEKELLDRALCEVGALRPRRMAGEPRSRERAAGRGR
jgi:2-oxoglutarate dehydrogenase E1 component